MLGLRHDTPAEWARITLDDLDGFLQNHAANERKVSQSALSLAVQHPDRPELVQAMIEMAREELEHFAQVYELLRERGCDLGRATADPYIKQLRAAICGPDVDEYLLDRLLMFGIIEARGCERFAMLAAALEPGKLKSFYEQLVKGEARHHATYINLARRYFDPERVQARLDELLEVEAQVARALPLRAELH